MELTSECNYNQVEIVLGDLLNKEHRVAIQDKQDFYLKGKFIKG